MNMLAISSMQFVISFVLRMNIFFFIWSECNKLLRWEGETPNRTYVPFYVVHVRIKFHFIFAGICRFRSLTIIYLMETIKQEMAGRGKQKQKSNACKHCLCGVVMPTHLKTITTHREMMCSCRCRCCCRRHRRAVVRLWNSNMDSRSSENEKQKITHNCGNSFWFSVIYLKLNKFLDHFEM